MKQKWGLMVILLPIPDTFPEHHLPLEKGDALPAALRKLMARNLPPSLPVTLLRKTSLLMNGFTIQSSLMASFPQWYLPMHTPPRLHIFTITSQEPVFMDAYIGKPSGVLPLPSQNICHPLEMLQPFAGPAALLTDASGKILRIFKGEYVTIANIRRLTTPQPLKPQQQ